jgi:lycopene beta-cyclase
MAYDYVFVGGGLSAGLAVLALLESRPELSIAVIERDTRLGGNHTWCFHAADVSRRAARFVDALVVRRWTGYEVRFPARMRRLSSPYACVTSERLHQVLSERLAQARACAVFLNMEAQHVSAQNVVLSDGRTLNGKVIVDARGPVLPHAGAVGYQKFLGLELEVAPDHGLERPLLIDACVRQFDGFRFLYVLPLTRERVLFEETFFSDAPGLDEGRSEQAILAYARAQGFQVRSVVRREHGVLPMPFQSAAASSGDGPLRAGYGAGFFHPVTGYSFPLAARFAETLAASASEPGAAIAGLKRQHDEQLKFLFLLTRLMFTCFPPHERYRVLEHFYRLPAPLIERFYAADLTLLDRARMLAGAPPKGLSLRYALGQVQP